MAIFPSSNRDVSNLLLQVPGCPPHVLPHVAKASVNDHVSPCMLTLEDIEHFLKCGRHEAKP
jgi:hypothetical protein